MTRFLVGLLLALAVGAMGCSETGGTGGAAGDGGSSGEGGSGGNGGEGGSENPVESCGIDDEALECRSDPRNGLCFNEVCVLFDCADAEEGSHCAYGLIKGATFGFCVGGVCELECTVMEEGAECRFGFPTIVESYGVGECVGPVCAGEIVENCGGLGMQRVPCRTDLASGLCADEVCVAADCAYAEDGGYCEYYFPSSGPFFGICVAGVCEVECDVLGDGAECRACRPNAPGCYGEAGVCTEGDCIELAGGDS